jgi:lipid-binding SYLF domain-containing protein
VRDKQVADQVVQFVFTGDRAVLNYAAQHAAADGTNIAAAAGPVTVAAANGTETSCCYLCAVVIREALATVSDSRFPPMSDSWPTRC